MWLGWSSVQAAGYSTTSSVHFEFICVFIACEIHLRFLEMFWLFFEENAQPERKDS